MDAKLIYKRCVILVGIVLSVLGAYIFKLADFQIINYRTYADSALSYTASSIKVTAARGEILDRYGRTIAYNRMGYAIIIQASEFNKLENPQRNEIIYRLTRIIDQNEGRNEDGTQKWEDSCPLIVDSMGNVSFAETAPPPYARWRQCWSCKPMQQPRTALMKWQTATKPRDSLRMWQES